MQDEVFIEDILEFLHSVDCVDGWHACITHHGPHLNPLIWRFKIFICPVGTETIDGECPSSGPGESDEPQQYHPPNECRCEWSGLPHVRALVECMLHHFALRDDRRP